MTVTRRTFAATGADVFAAIVDPTTYPEWLVGAKHIREVSPDWPAEGAWFRHVVGFGPLAIPDRTTVVGIDPVWKLELLVRARPLLEARVRFEIALDGDRCTLTMTEDPVGVYRLVGPLTQPLVRARNERSLQRLARLVERDISR